MNNKTFNKPIIFIHKNNSEYLEYVLRCAVLFNPDKEVILLGDPSNAHYKKLGILHYEYDDYATNEEIRKFDEVYTYIGGEKQTKPNWVKFVLRRWFHIYEFIQRHHIDSFWTFDSDNLIITSLSIQEYKFKAIDCTEQCNGSCMNGFITNQAVVKAYVNYINTIFQDESVLQECREGVIQNPSYALTEMYCYYLFKQARKPKTIPLNTIINGETFDQCICSQDDMEMYAQPLNGNKVKKLYVSKLGYIYSYHIPSQQYIRLNTINMSWVPVYTFERIVKAVEKRQDRLTEESSDLTKRLRVIDMSSGFVKPKVERVKNKVYRLLNIMPEYDLK